MRKDSCIACRFQKDGVKTRKSLIHTCGKYTINPMKKRYIMGADLAKGESLGAVFIIREDQYGIPILEYHVRTNPKNFTDEVEKTAEYYNAKIVKEGEPHLEKQKGIIQRLIKWFKNFNN